MPVWLTSLLFAVLVVTIPYILILKILLQLPKAHVLSHRRWPFSVNFLLITSVTAYATVFIHSVYYGRSPNSAALLMEFVIAALSYNFGLVLLLRQFAGVYPEYIVTTGTTGLSIRKTVYRNITDVEEISESYGETELRVLTSYGQRLPLTLPTRQVSKFYELLDAQQ